MPVTRELFGPRSERSQRLLDQLELQLEELTAAAGGDEAKVETASSPAPIAVASAPRSCSP
jgi:transposase